MKHILFPVALITALGFFTISQKNADTLSGRVNISYIQDSVRIELEKTSFKDMPVLFINDTASSTEKLTDVLSKDYGELMQFIQSNKLQPQKFMAWYYSVQPPWTMDVAIQTTNIPEQLSGRIQSRIQKGGEVLIAHMWGPYNQVGQAYQKIETWLKENKRQAKGNPFEVYINDPASVKNQFEIRTDIFQPIE